MEERELSIIMLKILRNQYHIMAGVTLYAQDATTKAEIFDQIGKEAADTRLMIQKLERKLEAEEFKRNQTHPSGVFQRPPF